MKELDFGWLQLLTASSIILIAFWLLWKYRTGLVKPGIIAFGRMALQLALAGIYLEYIFKLDSIPLNLLWLILIIIAASFSISKRVDIRTKVLVVPLLAALIISFIINGGAIALFLLGFDFLKSRYLIPISGMLIGNCLTAAIVGIRTFYNSLHKEQENYSYMLACGATKSEALFGFIRNALIEAFNPTIANTAAIGLIWLPGMMTGQILAGSSPITAIKYQIMIIVGIFVSGAITVYFSIIFSEKSAFDEYSNLRKDIFKAKK